MTFPSRQRIYQAGLMVFMIVGPGLITAVADNDAGGVATYTVAAAMFGMASQFFIIPTTLLLALTQEVGARISIVTGKGLGGLIREQYGVRAAIVIFSLYYIVNQGVVLQNMSGLKAALQLFGLPWQFSLIVICIVLSLVIIEFNYKKLQKVFLLMIAFYATYVISAIIIHPNWSDALRESMVWPQHVNIWNGDYWFSLIAVLGTTITAWGQFFISSYIVDKGLHVKDLVANRIEVYVGAILTNGISWMMAIAVTYTLFVHGITVSSGFEAAQAIAPLAGQFAASLFAFGLLSASLLGLAIVPLATAYVFTEMFGFERTLNVNFKAGKVFYVFFLIQLCFGALVTLVPAINLFQLTLYADYLNGAMLPVIFFFLIKFSTDKSLLGKHVISRYTKWALYLASGTITLAVAGTILYRLF